MSSEAVRATGLLGAAGSLLENALELVKNRFQLLGVELQEEKYRLVQLVIWLAAVVFAAMMTLTFVSLAVVYAFWATARLQVLIALSVFYAVSFCVVAWQFRRFLTTQPKPFSATLTELEKDAECIQPKS